MPSQRLAEAQRMTPPPSPHERFRLMLELVGPSVGPYIESHLERVYGSGWQAEARRLAYRSMSGSDPGTGSPRWEPATVFTVMLQTWERVFRPVLDHRVRTYIHELRTYRNDYAHQGLDEGDVDRAIDTARRLFVEIGASDAANAAATLANGYKGPEPARRPAPTTLGPSPSKEPRPGNWTSPGTVNENRQRNEGRLDVSGNHPNQRAYLMTCLACDHQYASNGCDIHIRKCPRCQGGAPSASGWSATP